MGRRLGFATLSKTQFRTLFVLGPLLMCSIVPSAIFGVLFGEWGSNLIWGRFFGLGWCLAAFASGNIFRDDFSGTVGLMWGWGVLVPLYVAAGWLWERLSPRARKNAAALILVSFLFIVPSRTLLGWEERRFHLPDYTLHLATSF